MNGGELGAGDRLGPWEVLERLGEGGTAVVYRACRADDRSESAALKVLRPEMAADPEVRRRFAREARANRLVSHARLVPVLDVGEERGLPWLALRLVPGPSLADRLAEAPLPVSLLVSTVQDLAGALDALHNAGIVHRDVKPANVLFEPDGHAVLADLGLARGERDSLLTRRGDVVGTIDYLPPERIRGHAATPVGDVYALGCLAFECLAGTPPFADLPPLEAARAHIEADPPDPCRLRSDVPAGLGWPVRQALAKDPGQRPATAGAFARLLVLAAADRGVRDRLGPQQH